MDASTVEAWAPSDIKATAAATAVGSADPAGPDPIDLSITFKLHSRPGAPRIILLDFTGQAGISGRLGGWLSAGPPACLPAWSTGCLTAGLAACLAAWLLC